MNKTVATPANKTTSAKAPASENTTKGEATTGTAKSGIMGIFGTIKPEKELSGFMTPEGMAGLLFISNFENTDPDSPAPNKHGYQRQPIEDRVPGIARFFLEQGDDNTIPALTLSVRLSKPADIKKFIALFNKGDKMGILKEFGQSVISVVDGQHRFLGLVRAWNQKPESNPRVPVTLKFGLSFEEEARLFDTINTTQRKLPKALIEVTKADVTEVGSVSYQQTIRLIALKLARDEASVWYGRVNMTGARNPMLPISFEGLRRSTLSMFPKELLERIEIAEKEPHLIAMDYWNNVAEACSKAWNSEPRIEYSEEDGSPVVKQVLYRINELVGVAALAKLGQDIIASSLEHENFDERLKMLTGRLAEVDWEKNPENPWMRNQQAGMAGQRDLYTMLYKWVYSNRKPV